jgi:peroxin-5
MLGVSHAENDEDRKAIMCLKTSVNHDPYNLEALLALGKWAVCVRAHPTGHMCVMRIQGLPFDLGVSYVNELDSQNALRVLKGWVEHNPQWVSQALVF